MEKSSTVVYLSVSDLTSARLTCLDGGMLSDAYANTMSMEMSSIIPIKTMTMSPLFTIPLDRSHGQSTLMHYLKTTIFDELGTKSATVAAKICRRQNNIPSPIITDDKDLKRALRPHAFFINSE